MNSSHVHVEDADAEILSALATHMTKILEAFRAYGRVDPTWAIADQSPVNEDRELLLRQFGPGGAWTSKAADYAADAALLFLLAQSDHLAVLQQIYETYVGLMFGVGPPARSLLETNGYVYWLVHPDVPNIRTRASRALLARLNDATRELSTAKDLGVPPQLLSSVGQALRNLKDLVPVHFYGSEIHRDKSGNLFLRGEKHPGPSEVLRHLSVAGGNDWNSRGAYSFLSNASHPTLHIITDTIRPVSDGKNRFGHSDTLYHYRLARMTMAGFLSTWQITAAYRGLEQGPAQQLLREIDTLPEP